MKEKRRDGEGENERGGREEERGGSERGEEGRKKGEGESEGEEGGTKEWHVWSVIGFVGAPLQRS